MLVQNLLGCSIYVFIVISKGAIYLKFFQSVNLIHALRLEIVVYQGNKLYGAISEENLDCLKTFI